MAATFSKEDYDYFTSDERQGEGEWTKYLAADKGASSPLLSPTLADSSRPDQAIVEARAALQPLEDLLSESSLFFQSPSAPGWADFSLMGMHRFLASVDTKITSEVWDQGKIGKWLERMHSQFAEGLADVRRRDPK